MSNEVSVLQYLKNEFEKDKQRIELIYKHHLYYKMKLKFNFCRYIYDEIASFCNSNPCIQEIQINIMPRNKKIIFKHLKKLKIDTIYSTDIKELLDECSGIEEIECDEFIHDDMLPLKDSIKGFGKLKRFFIGDGLHFGNDLKELEKCEAIEFLYETKFANCWDKETKKSTVSVPIERCTSSRLYFVEFENIVSWAVLPYNIKRLEVVYIRQYDFEYIDMYEYISKLKKLKELRLHFSEIDLKIDKSILKNLEVLEIAYDFENIDIIKDMDCLRELVLDSSKITRFNYLELLQVKVDTIYFRCDNKALVSYMKAIKPIIYDGGYYVLAKPRYLFEFKSFQRHFDLSFNYYFNKYYF